jgi:hypothetical protein
MLDEISSLYNYAVSMARRATFMDLGGDGIKVASQLFRKSAWAFNHLISMSTQLAPNLSSTDFDKECLNMLSNLCLAQAQYLFFKKASDAGMQGPVLAKIAAQTAIYFDTAHRDNQVNQKLRAYQQGKFANVLGYHARYFRAQSYWHLGMFNYTEAGKKGKGMGDAASYLLQCVNIYKEAGPFANALGGSYKQNFDAKFAEAQAAYAKAE